ncbi:MAG: metallophosphoesterase [Candidatus Pacearchaeota archaeon]
MKREFEILDKVVFFPREGMLVFGDMHLGYEAMLSESGILLPSSIREQIFNDVEKIISLLINQNKFINEIIFLGDVKHYFSYNKLESKDLSNLIVRLKSYLPKVKIFFVRGNHEVFANLNKEGLLDYYIKGDKAFIHGDREFDEIFEKRVKMIVMAHLHPAVTIIDNQRIRAEKYKCFLFGRYRNKQVLILPSFLPLVEGSSVNEYLNDSLCIVPSKNLKDFEVIIFSDGREYNFGKLRHLILTE